MWVLAPALCAAHFICPMWFTSLDVTAVHARTALGSCTTECEHVCKTSLFRAPQVPLSEERAAQKAKPEKMAIGGDGGFQVLHGSSSACSTC